jgi:hypothetical protein
MLIKLMRMLEMITGCLLCSLCAGIQLGNVLICVFIVLMVPAVLVGWAGQ